MKFWIIDHPLLPNDERTTVLSQPAKIDQFMRLYAGIQRRLYVFIITFVPDSAEAEDLLQETSLLLWEKFDDFQPDTNFLAWARAIARNKIWNHRVKRERSMVMLEPEAMDALFAESAKIGSGDDDLRRAALVQCLDKLAEKDRVLIKRRYEPGVSVRELADHENRSPNAVSQSLGRIRGLLLDCVRRTLAREDGGAWA